MTARTAYGLETPRGFHWADLAACSPARNPGVDPEWWWPMPGQASPETMRAAHICRAHCPVRVACHADTLQNPPVHACVQAGRRYVLLSGGSGRVVESKQLPSASAGGCPYCSDATKES